MTDSNDGSGIENMVVKNNGFPIGTTNKGGDIFMTTIKCLPLNLSGEKLPFYKTTYFPSQKLSEEMIELRIGPSIISGKATVRSIHFEVLSFLREPWGGASVHLESRFI